VDNILLFNSRSHVTDGVDSVELQSVTCKLKPSKKGLTVGNYAENSERLQADEPLAKFLDYCTYGHMIDNVVLIVTGTLHERDVHVRSFLCVECTAPSRALHI